VGLARPTTKASDPWLGRGLGDDYFFFLKNKGILDVLCFLIGFNKKKKLTDD
jgi:hypothetical protein